MGREGVQGRGKDENRGQGGGAAQITESQEVRHLWQGQGEPAIPLRAKGGGEMGRGGVERGVVRGEGVGGKGGTDNRIQGSLSFVPKARGPASHTCA